MSGPALSSSDIIHLIGRIKTEMTVEKIAGLVRRQMMKGVPTPEFSDFKPRGTNNVTSPDIRTAHSTVAAMAEISSYPLLREIGNAKSAKKAVEILLEKLQKDDWKLYERSLEEPKFGRVVDWVYSEEMKLLGMGAIKSPDVSQPLWSEHFSNELTTSRTPSDGLSAKKACASPRGSPAKVDVSQLLWPGFDSRTTAELSFTRHGPVSPPFSPPTPDLSGRGYRETSSRHSAPARKGKWSPKLPSDRPGAPYVDRSYVPDDFYLGDH